MNYIEVLKEKYVKIKNPRTQRINEVSGHAEIFIKFYNYLYKNEISDCRMDLEGSYCDVEIVFKNTQALSSEEYKKYDQSSIKNPVNIWDEYSNVVYDLISDTNAKRRRRFRKLIPVSKIVNLSTMIYKVMTAE